MIRLATIVVVLLLTWTAAAPAQDKVLQKAIDESVVRGVAYLRTLQQPDGTWPYEQIGATALAGLTLLECGVSERDAAIQKAAWAVREAAAEASLTYSASLIIMFLDRLGDPLDVPIIEVLAARLMCFGGPGATGTWSYGLDDFAKERLDTYVKLRKQGRVRPINKAKEVTGLPRDIQFLLARIPEWRNGIELTGGDNSNSQFATLALWVARRYGLPVHKRLVFVDQVYRKSQMFNGGWAYNAFEPDPEDKASYVPNPSMMCTGLIGMAAYYGARKDPNKRPILEDSAIQKALKGIEKQVGHPTGPKTPPALPFGGSSYYYFWTLERTAMLYGLNKIGGKDWYSWGAEAIVAHQAQTGAWEGDYTVGGADTCFALLFLKRSNIAPDLTNILMQGITRDSASPQKGAPGSVNSGTKDSPTKADVSTAQARAEAVRLSTALLDAPANELDAILEKFRAGKGAPFNQTLAAAIPQLKGDTQSKARKTLAERLATFPPADIRKEMKSIDAEIRRAAAGACAVSKTKELVPDLTDLLADSESGVVQAARQSLREVTSQDFGPPDGASREDREKAIRAWRAWWKSQ